MDKQLQQELAKLANELDRKLWSLVGANRPADMEFFHASLNNVRMARQQQERAEQCLDQLTR